MFGLVIITKNEMICLNIFAFILNFFYHCREKAQRQKNKK